MRIIEAKQYRNIAEDQERKIGQAREMTYLGINPTHELVETYGVYITRSS